MKEKNIIFLDIDGVVNTRNHLGLQKMKAGTMDNRNWCPIACRHVSLLCKQFNARIVISSTWRIDHNTNELCKLLTNNNIEADYLLGTTPALIREREVGSFCRGDEIQHWLDGNAYHAYVILDDAPASKFLPEQHAHLIRVNPKEGFAHKESAIKAGEVLGRG